MRGREYVFTPDMTDQDSAIDQSNRPEDTDQERIEYVEWTDVGVSLTVKLKRGTATRDQDEVIAKAKRLDAGGRPRGYGRTPWVHS